MIGIKIIKREANSIRKKLQGQRIYTATYWSNVLDWTQSKDFEYRVSNTLLPLPININQEQLNYVIKSL